MNVAECIPYKTFKERLKITKREINKGRYVEIWDEHIYSAKKWSKGDTNEW